jgi:flagellar FliL protein
MTVTAMPNNDTKDEKKGGRRNLIIIAVLLLVILAGGAYLVLKPKGGGSAKPPAPKPGAVLSIGTLQLNLADGHYLSMGLALQLTTKASDDLNASEAKDAAIAEYSGLSLQQVDTAAQRLKLKTQLLKTLETDYPDEVMAVYYTAFVTQ